MFEAASDPVKRRLSDFSHVLLALETFCATLRPGARLPTHTALMVRLGASERMVLRALDELQRSGRVVRRNGIGTFVAEREERGPAHTVVAIAEPDRFFDDRGVAELFRCAEAAGISLVCRPVSAQAERAHLPLPGGHPSHGYLLFRYSLAPLAVRLQAAGCRVVLVGAPPVGVVPEVPCVYSDEEHGGYLALRRLCELGHRHVLLGADADLRETPRRHGYQRALHEARLMSAEIRVSSLDRGDIDAWTKDPQLATEFFRASDAPTALLAWNDLNALTLLPTLRRAGVRVPDDLSLMGYGALPETERTYPTLSTVDEGVCSQLQAALRLLTLASPPPCSHSTVLVPTLVCRESTAGVSRK